MMLKGKTFLLLEQAGASKVIVSAHRARRPDRYSRPGVWIALDLVIPDSVFAHYRAALELPEHDTSSLIEVLPEKEAS